MFLCQIDFLSSHNTNKYNGEDKKSENKFKFVLTFVKKSPFSSVMNVHLVAVSSNAKTGPIPVSTSSEETCPDVCPFKASKMCYAKSGPLALHWNKVSNGVYNADLSWSTFLTKIKALRFGQLWRHNQAGDLPGVNEEIDTEKLNELVEANKGKKGFTYTHKPVENNPKNAEAVKNANKNGFTVNLSANNLEHADELLAMNIGPVCSVVPINQTKNTVTPKGTKVVICPAAVRENVSCSTCKLCAHSERKYVIGFPAHGTKKKVMDKFVSVSTQPAVAA